VHTSKEFFDSFTMVVFLGLLVGPGVGASFAKMGLARRVEIRLFETGLEHAIQYALKSTFPVVVTHAVGPAREVDQAGAGPDFLSKADFWSSVAIVLIPVAVENIERAVGRRLVGTATALFARADIGFSIKCTPLAEHAALRAGHALCCREDPTADFLLGQLVALTS